MKHIYLRTARREKHLTQAVLARMVRKPQSFISRLERGDNTNPSFREVIALAKALEVDPLALRFGPARVQPRDPDDTVDVVPPV